MSEFSKRLQEKLTRLTTAALPVTSNVYDAALDEFVRTLNEANLDLIAEKAEGAFPQRRTIVVRPRYRQSPRSPLLNFWIDAPRIYLQGEGQREFASVDELKRYLEDFVDHSHFPDTVAAFQEIAQEPVMGYLRTGGAFDLAPEDVLVVVPPGEQQRLATARPGETLTIDVTPQRFPGAGDYDPARGYTALESAGYALHPIRVAAGQEGQLVVSGTVIAPFEAAAAE